MDGIGGKLVRLGIRENIVRPDAGIFPVNLVLRRGGAGRFGFFVHVDGISGQFLPGKFLLWQFRQLAERPGNRVVEMGMTGRQPALDSCREFCIF